MPRLLRPPAPRTRAAGVPDLRVPRAVGCRVSAAKKVTRPAATVAVDCSKYPALAPDTRALIYSGIDNMRDLAVVAKSVQACGLTCEVTYAAGDGAPKVAVYAARREWAASSSGARA